MSRRGTTCKAARLPGRLDNDIFQPCDVKWQRQPSALHHFAVAAMEGGYSFPPIQGRTMKSLELFVERIILSSRWILVAFYLGLVAALAIYAVSFAYKFWKVALNTFAYDEADMILAMLSLIDAALVASLIVMVMISGYENFVSRFDDEEGTDVSFLGKLDSGSLKIKVASSIVAISSIHLLQVFLNANQYDNIKLAMLTAIHIAFVISALMLGYLEKIMTSLKSKGSDEDKGL
jgi:uncharacterized protein (TIGR00645 family)